ncbi:MAG: hypothetical protein AB8B53_02430 [Flavobacteriales bacterium]
MNCFSRLLMYFFILVGSSQALSQGTPQGLYYQAVARGLEGEQLSEEDFSIRLNILEDSDIIYTELHSPTTDSFGLFELIIGNGNVELGDFSTINWGSDSYFLNIEMDLGEGFTSISTTQFLSVPYSLYASQAESVINDNVEDADSNPQNELIESFLIEDENLIINEAGDSFSIPLAELTDDGDWMIIDENTISSQDYNVGINTSNPTSTLSVNGSFSMNVQTITSDLNETVESAIGFNNSIILCDVAFGDIILNLPEASSCTGRTYSFKRFDSEQPGSTSTANTLTLTPQTDDFIDFQSSFTLESNDYEQVQIVSDGDNWFIISYSRNP